MLAPKMSNWVGVDFVNEKSFFFISIQYVETSFKWGRKRFHDNRDIYISKHTHVPEFIHIWQKWTWSILLQAIFCSFWVGCKHNNLNWFNEFSTLCQFPMSWVCQSATQVRYGKIHLLTSILCFAPICFRKRFKKKITNVSFAFRHTYTFKKTKNVGFFSQTYKEIFEKRQKTLVYCPMFTSSR